MGKLLQRMEDMLEALIVGIIVLSLSPLLLIKEIFSKKYD
jgi:hypothetical protein